jgi:DNA-directed RNA polymerase specialized sigma24 family protein
VCSSLSSDDEQIKALLAGESQAVAKGLTWIDHNYRYKISGLLRQRFAGLSAEDLAEVWQDSLVALYRMISQGTFRPEGQLAALLWTLAVRRGQDRLRRNATWHRPIDVLMHDLREPQLTEKWHALNALQRREAVELICDSIARLPPRQNLVWRVYVRHFPDSERLEFLTTEVRRALSADRSPSAAASGPDESLALTKKSVSSALFAGREKIREDLKRKGYDL